MKKLIIALLLVVSGIFPYSMLYAQSKSKLTTFEKYELEQTYKKACDAGETPNCFMLGLHYKKYGNKKQKAESKKLIKDACSKGEKLACENITGGVLANRGSDLIFYGSLALIGIAALIVASLMFQEEEEFKAQEQLEDAGKAMGKKEIAKHGVVLQYSRPLFRRYVTPIVSQLKNKKKIKDRYKRKLASAGLTEILTPEDFFSFKLFLIVGFPILFLAVRAFLEETWPLSLIPVMGFVGFFYPDIWINGKIQQRQTEVIKMMPFAVDMLALSVEAGLDFVAAMAKVVEKARPGALTYEFEQMMKEIRIGASRAEALRNMAWRIDLIQVSSFCATLIAADSVGASIGPILKGLSGEIRQKKSADAEKAGATAATKILFPMLFLIVPAVFIVVAAPIALEMILGKK